MALGLIFGGCIILIYQKMKWQSKNYEILNKQKLRKKIYIYLPLTCFLFRNSLTTIYSRTIISSSSGMSCKSSVSKIAAEFSPFVFLPLSTRAYFKGRAYIKIILKNHARSYFAGRSYYWGNTVRCSSEDWFERERAVVDIHWISTSKPAKRGKEEGKIDQLFTKHQNKDWRLSSTTEEIDVNATHR